MSTHTQLQYIIDKQKCLQNILTWNKFYKKDFLINTFLNKEYSQIGNETFAMFQDIENILISDKLSNGFYNEETDALHYSLNYPKIDPILIDEILKIIAKIRTDVGRLLQITCDTKCLSILYDIVHKLHMFSKLPKDVQTTIQNVYYNTFTTIDVSDIIKICNSITQLYVTSAENRHEYQCHLLESKCLPIPKIEDSRTGEQIVIDFTNKIINEMLPKFKELNITCIIDPNFYELMTVGPFLYASKPTQTELIKQLPEDLIKMKTIFSYMLTKCEMLFFDKDILKQGFDYLAEIETTFLKLKESGDMTQYTGTQNTHEIFSNLVRYSRILKANTIEIVIIIENILEQSNSIFKEYLRILNEVIPS